ncbi:MAG: insulinase family protein [Myxococcota bacterium]|nr:insulinase family protein [Myxococcota bacterium]
MHIDIELDAKQMRTQRLTAKLTLLLLVACQKPGLIKTDVPAPAVNQVAAQQTQEMPWDSNVRRGRLENGLRFYIEENKEPLKRAELRLVVLAGSTSEDEDQLGLAHVVEHMAFNGSKNFTGNELISTLEKFGMGFGAHLNAYTSFDETVYKLQIPTEPALLDKAFVILRDWAGDLTFDESEVEKERGVVLDEWRRSLGAGRRIQTELLPLQFNHSRYAKRLPIGTEASLKTFSREHLLRFYRDWYRPDLMAIVAVGDFNATEIETRIRTLFSDLEAPSSSRPRAVFEVPAYTETQYHVASDPELTSSAVTLSTIVDYQKPTTVPGYRRMMMEQVTLSMMNSRLRELREQAAPVVHYAALYQRPLGAKQATRGLMIAPFEDKSSQAVSAALRLIIQAQTHGFTNTELERAKLSILQYFERALKEDRTESSADAAAELVRHVTTGETIPGLIEEARVIRQVIPSISQGEVNAFIKTFFGDRHLLVTGVYPEKSDLVLPTKMTLKSWTDDALAQVVDKPYSDKVVNQPLVARPPQPGKVISEKKDPVLGTTEWLLSNGLTVILKPTNFDDNNISFSAWRRGGHSLVRDEEFSSASIASNLASQSGIGAYSRNELTKKLVGQRVGVNFSIGELYVTLGGSAAIDDTDTLFQLLWLKATQSRIDENAFSRFIRTQQERIRNRELQPSTKFYDRYTEVLWGGHLRRSPPSLQQLSTIQLAKSRRYLKAVQSNWHGTTFVFVGKFQPDQLKAQIERWIGGLPVDNTAVVDYRDLGIRAAQGVHEETIRSGKDPKALAMIRFSGEFQSTPRTRYILRSLARVLSIQLREKLREELGGTYSASASASVSTDPAHVYSLTIRFSCDPKRIDELKAAAYGVLDRVIARPVPSIYTDKVSAQQAREDEVNKRQNSYWENVIQSNRSRREPVSALVEYWGLNKELSPDWVHQAARKYLNRERRIDMVLVPENQ